MANIMHAHCHITQAMVAMDSHGQLFHPCTDSCTTHFTEPVNSYYKHSVELALKGVHAQALAVRGN